MARYMDLIYQTIATDLQQFGRLYPDQMKYADAVGRIRAAGDFVARVQLWYEAALEQMEYCPFCGTTTPTHGERCPMALIVERDTVFVQ